jgi:hypothetical protein
MPCFRLSLDTHSATFAVSLLLLSSCRDATQITLNVRTNVPCTDQGAWQGVAVYVGRPGSDVEQVSPTLVTRDCDEQGNVGSLVVVPSADKDEEVGLRVVAGLSQNPEQCEEQDYEGCIVARRTVRFNPHASLELDVELTSDCVSIGCSAELTCVSGSCRNSRQASKPMTVLPPAEPNVRCGDNGVLCPTSGDVCCLSVDTAAGTTFGECRPPDTCPSSSLVLYCDDEDDCPSRSPDGVVGICNLAYEYTQSFFYEPTRISGSDCNFGSKSYVRQNIALGLCQTRDSCAVTMAPCIASQGAPNQLPGYFWCELSIP